MQQNILYDIPEACAILRCSRASLYRLMHRGDITPIKLGRRTLIPHRQIVDFVERAQQAAS